MLKNVISAGPKMPAGLAELYAMTPGGSTGASLGIDRPEAVVRMVVIDAIRMFVRLTGHQPRLLYIPISLEAALQVDRGRNMGLHEATNGKIRSCSVLFTCKPIWDAKEFKVE